MDKTKLNYVLIFLVICLLLLVVLLLIRIYVKLNARSVNAENEVKSVESIESTESTYEESTTSKSSSKKSDTSSNTSSNSVTYSDNDKLVISELETIESASSSSLATDDEKTAKEKAKGVFISLVDFIFYDGEIKGVKFDELTDSGKQKVLSIASSIDTKAENKFPGYKESISDKTKSAFTKASSLIKSGAANINDFSREKLGEENYNSIIDAKDELVTYTKKAASIVKNVGGSFISGATSKIKSWYENFRDGN